MFGLESRNCFVRHQNPFIIITALIIIIIMTITIGTRIYVYIYMYIRTYMYAIRLWICMYICTIYNVVEDRIMKLITVQ